VPELVEVDVDEVLLCTVDVAIEVVVSEDSVVDVEEEVDVEVEEEIDVDVKEEVDLDVKEEVDLDADADVDADADTEALPKFAPDSIEGYGFNADSSMFPALRLMDVDQNESASSFWLITAIALLFASGPIERRLPLNPFKSKYVPSAWRFSFHCCPGSVVAFSSWGT